MGRSEECAQEFAPQSHIHSGLNQLDLVFSDVFLAHSDQYADGRWWFGSSCQGCSSGLSVGHIHQGAVIILFLLILIVAIVSFLFIWNTVKWTEQPRSQSLD